MVGGAVHMPSDLPPILRLPNELLGAIASELATKDILNLIQTCRALRYVSQAALLRPVKIRGHVIRRLLEILVDDREMAKRINHVDLGNYLWDETLAPGYQNIPFRFDSAYRALVQRVHGSINWLQVRGRGIEWRDQRMYHLFLVGATLPNLRELSIEFRGFTSNAPDPSSVGRYYPRSGYLFPRHILKVYGDKITALTITSSGAYTRKLCLRGLSKLKYLTLPNIALGHILSRLACPGEGLPATIEHVRILDSFTYGDDEGVYRTFIRWQYILNFLVELAGHRERYKCLRTVDLCFKYSLISAAAISTYDLTTRSLTRFPRFFQLVDELSRKGLTVTVTTDYDAVERACVKRYNAQALLEEARRLGALCYGGTPGQLDFFFPEPRSRGWRARLAAFTWRTSELNKRWDYGFVETSSTNPFEYRRLAAGTFFTNQWSVIPPADPGIDQLTALMQRLSIE